LRGKEKREKKKKGKQKVCCKLHLYRGEKRGPEWSKNKKKEKKGEKKGKVGATLGNEEKSSLSLSLCFIFQKDLGKKRKNKERTPVIRAVALTCHLQYSYNGLLAGRERGKDRDKGQGKEKEEKKERRVPNSRRRFQQGRKEEGKIRKEDNKKKMGEKRERHMPGRKPLLPENPKKRGWGEEKKKRNSKAPHPPFIPPTLPIQHEGKKMRWRGKKGGLQIRSSPLITTEKIEKKKCI